MEEYKLTRFEQEIEVGTISVLLDAEENILELEIFVGDEPLVQMGANNTIKLSGLLAEELSGFLGKLNKRRNL